MIERFLGRISREIIKSAEDEQKYAKYVQLQQTDGWHWYMRKLLLIKGLMAEEVLSPAFSKLPPHEKDVRQQAYAGINSLLDWLMNPMLPAQKHLRLVQQASKMEATRKEATKQKGAK